MLLCHLLALAALTLQSSGGRLAYTAPAGWNTRPPASSMRVAEFVIPKAAGDQEDAELIIYYFGGQGGSADANIERWIGQMQQPGGAPSTARARRDTRTINGLKVSMVDVSGTYVAEMSPGAAEHFNKPDFRLRAAVVQTANGPYYVKLTGPEKTVSAAGPAFDRFMSSLRFVK
ncbi:MAG TPA: hypothetical protein VGL62_11110 [Vicinamibacterales bacterium]|jgi:hypothetical protein